MLIFSVQFLSILAFVFFVDAQTIDGFDAMALRMSKAKKTPVVKNTDLEKALKGKSILFLDAREKNEYEVSHIPGAEHVGFEKFNLKQTLSRIGKAKKVVVYCSVGYRSSKITQKLVAEKINAFNLIGGVFGWANDGKPLVDSNFKKTKKVHGYNKEWSKWLKKGLAVF